MKSAVSAALEVAGVAAIAYGLSLLAVWAGVVAGGVGLVLLGLAVDPPAKPSGEGGG